AGGIGAGGGPGDGGVGLAEGIAQGEVHEGLDIKGGQAQPQEQEADQPPSEAGGGINAWLSDTYKKVGKMTYQPYRLWPTGMDQR
ncbi:MAG: hypothetical protein SF053_02995, partial [Bacteroidia bacterium]|nr:hypothetical protein [Bacteroidia bacterium]